MSKRKLIEVLGGWEGYTLGTVGRKDGEAWIELHPVAGVLRTCGGCGGATPAIHDTTQRWVRDLPILDAPTRLLVHRCRVLCERCGPKIEELSWLDRYSRVTRRLAESVARLCRAMPIKSVADFFALNWHTVKAIDKAFLSRELGPVDLSDVELILLDEFAIQKGHRYATVVVEARRKQVLWVGRGRSRLEVRPFFELLGEEGCRRIRAAGIDMNGAYEEEIRLHCPQAAIVYDLFHVVAKYGREVVDRARVDAANRLRHDKAARRVVKSARWLLLRNRENLKGPQDHVRLQELLDANQDLLTVYLLKEDLKRLWQYRHRGYAARFWAGWLERAQESGIPALQRFARNLERYLEGILAHCRWRLHTSLLEGINNRIKVIKRTAYGYRDDEYFFLKIRAAFPGIPR